MLLTIACGAFAACRKDDETVEPAPLPALPTRADTAPPADHLGEGELLEGTEKAFGLTLPRLVKVDSRFVDLVYASGTPRPDAVANYIRERVRFGCDGRGHDANGMDDGDARRALRSSRHVVRDERRARRER